MTKAYIMQTCPDCAGIKEQAVGATNLEIIDIGLHVKNLRQFIQLRDTHPAFDEAKRNGNLGIPCFVLDDGTVTFNPQDVGLGQVEVPHKTQCSIDGKGC